MELDDLELIIEAARERDRALKDRVVGGERLFDPILNRWIEPAKECTDETQS